MDYSIIHLHLSEASRGIIIEATVSVPTHRQFTNETHCFKNIDFHDYNATRSTLLALWYFWHGLRRRIRDLQRLKGDFDLFTTNFSKGIARN